MSYEPTRLRYAGPTLWTVLVALVVGLAAVASATMPDPMTIHWRMGLDGAVSERTVSRSLVSVLFVSTAIVTLVVALAFDRVRKRSTDLARTTELAVVYDLVVTAVLVSVVAAQALLLVLNALIA